MRPSHSLATAAAAARGSALTWTSLLPGRAAAVTVTGRRVPRCSGRASPPHAFTQLVRSRNAVEPCTSATPTRHHQRVPRERIPWPHSSRLR